MEHKKLDVWNKSIELVVEIYNLTNAFPKEEIYGLTSQIRRSAVSIPSNIAEGSARKGDPETIQFLHIALGSMAELETQLIISQKIGYIESIEGLNSKLLEIKQMTLGLIKFLKAKKPSTSSHVLYTRIAIFFFPRKQKSLIPFFLEDARKNTKIEDFIFFGTRFTDLSSRF